MSPSPFCFNWNKKEWIAASPGALFLPEASACFVADIHLGKTEHFRKSGIGMPAYAGEKDLAALRVLFSVVAPTTFFFLGDLFHSEANEALACFKHLLSECTQHRYTLIKGNHDILSKAQYQGLGLEVQEEGYTFHDLILGHDPAHPSGPHLAGHIHPGIRLKGSGKQRLRLPMWWIKPGQIILPAFGNLTGLAACQPSKTDIVLALTDTKIIPISGPEAKAI